MAGNSKRKILIGPRLKRLRTSLGLTQAELAQRIDVSATYVNLIERNQRPVSANVLLKLAEVFDMDLSDVAQDSDVSLVNELQTALRDPVFGKLSIDRNQLEDLVGAGPKVIKAFIDLHERYRDLALSTYSDTNLLADREEVELLEETTKPVRAVREYLHQKKNYFPDLDAAASELHRELKATGAPLGMAVRDRLTDKHKLKVRVLPVHAMPSIFSYFDRHRAGIDLSELLHPAGQRFQLAFQLAFLEHAPLIDEHVRDAGFKDENTIGLARVSMANYMAAATLMPYDPFLEACERTKYDVDLLSHRFETSFEQTTHRLTTLQKPDARGIPFFFIRIDIAGNVAKRFSAGRFHFSKFGGACPLWNIHRTFEQPGEILTQLIQMPDDTTYMSISKAVTRSFGHYGRAPVRAAIGLGCDVAYAPKLVYWNSFQDRKPDPTPIGVNCYLCDRANCPSRAFAPLNRKLQFDAHARGTSPYTFDPK